MCEDELRILPRQLQPLRLFPTIIASGERLSEISRVRKTYQSNSYDPDHDASDCQHDVFFSPFVKRSSRTGTNLCSSSLRNTVKRQYFSSLLIIPYLLHTSVGVVKMAIIWMNHQPHQMTQPEFGIVYKGGIHPEYMEVGGV